MSANRVPSCARCHLPLVGAGPDGALQCAVCAKGSESPISREVMAELSAYWERRLMEGREKDWT